MDTNIILCRSGSSLINLCAANHRIQHIHIRKDWVILIFAACRKERRNQTALWTHRASTATLFGHVPFRRMKTPTLWLLAYLDGSFLFECFHSFQSERYIEKIFQSNHDNHRGGWIQVNTKSGFNGGVHPSQALFTEVGIRSISQGMRHVLHR